MDARTPGDVPLGPVSVAPWRPEWDIGSGASGGAPKQHGAEPRRYAGAMAAEASGKGDAPLEFRSGALAQALEKQDIAAVALALRNGTTVAPLLKPGPRDDSLDGGEVWTYRDAVTGDAALLLFSDSRNKPANLPQGVGAFSPAWLRTFLAAHRDAITTVFLDIAGPHPMQASPDELLKALDP